MASWFIAVTLLLAGGGLAWLLRGWVAAAGAAALRARIDELARQLTVERREVEAARNDHRRLAERLRRVAGGRGCALRRGRERRHGAGQIGN
jgi:hypothetical protein